MQDKIFEWGGAVLTVKPATIGNNIAFHVYSNAISEQRPDTYPVLKRFFAKAAAQTTIVGDIGWVIPNPGDVEETIAQSFDDWLELPPDLGDLWLDALMVADAPTAPDELQPDADIEALDPKD